MVYDGQTIVDIDVTRPDGDAEPKSILDDVTKEIKRVLKNTPYSWCQFTNLTGAALAVGDVVALGSTAGNSGLIIDDTQGGFFKYVVVVEPIAAAAVGLVAYDGGPVAALAAGPVTAFHYIRKSNTSKSFEDMGIAVAGSTLAPNSAMGFALESVSAAGFCDIFLFERSAALPSALTAHVLNLVNRTGVVVAPGESVSPSPFNDNSVVANDITGTIQPVLVAFESIPNNVTGRWIQSGLQNVIVQGNVNRLDYLRKSGTARALESAGVTVNENSGPPPGAVGVALSPFTGGSGSVSALLFGSTVPLSTMAVPVVNDLSASPNPSFPSVMRDYIFPQATMFNPINKSTVALIDGTTITCNILIQGRGGRDQASGFPGNVWIYFYGTWDGATRSVRASLNPPNVGPNLANGETHYIFLDTVRNDSGGALLQVQTRGDTAYYVSPQYVLASGGAFSEVQLPVTSFVPFISSRYSISVTGRVDIVPPSTNSNYYLRIRQYGGGIDFIISPLSVSGSLNMNTTSAIGFTAEPINTAYLSYFWQFLEGNGPALASANVSVLSYKISH